MRGDFNFEDVGAVAAAVAVRAADENIAEKLHLDFLETGAPAAFALALARVEAEGAGVQTPLLGQFGLGKELADVIECADIDGGIRARGFAQDGLLHQDDAAQMLRTGEAG